MNTHATLESARAELEGIDQLNYFSRSVTPQNPLTGVWSKSQFSRLIEDPARWAAGIPFKETAKMRFGSMVDDYLFMPDQFRQTYKQTSDCPWNKNPGRAEAAMIRKEGKTPMKPSEMERILNIEQSLLGAGEHAKAMLDGAHQVPVLGVIEVKYCRNGDPLHKTLFIPVKGLLDSLSGWAGGDTLYDMKITSAEDNGDLWSIFTKFKYHLQDELYSQIHLANGNPVKDFKFVFVQDEAPFRVQVVDIDDNMRQNAGFCINKACQILAAMAEGWSPTNLYPDVLTLGTQSPWSRFPTVDETLESKIAEVNVTFHGKS